MSKQFATYEISKKLAELKFNESCFGYYDKDGEFWYFETDDFNSFFSKNKISELSDNRPSEPAYPNLVCTAPLWQQAIDFLREKGVYVCETQRKLTEETPVYIVKEVGCYALSERYSLEKAILKAFELIKV